MSRFFSTISVQLYAGFWIGVVVTAIAFTFLLVNHYTSNHFLRQNNIYLDGKFYKLCEARKCK